MAAPLGNTYQEKFKTPEERRDMWQKLCEHLRKGYSKKSFPLLSHDRMSYYATRYPEECDPEELAEAEREGVLYWEDVGKRGTTGSIKGFSSGSWKFTMMNFAGWSDKVDGTHEYRVSAGRELADAIREEDHDEQEGEDENEESV